MISKSNLRILLALGVVLVSPLAYAQWWNPFGPKNYDECVLDKIKDVHGEEAVAALKESCMNKFPPESTPAEKAAYEALAKRRKACGIADEDYKTQILFSVDPSKPRGRVVADLISNLSKISKSYDQFWFQNNNSFAVRAVQVGFSKNKDLRSWRSQDFDLTVYCGTQYEAVLGNSYGHLTCQPVSSDANTMYFWIIGISPVYDHFNSELPDFMEAHGMCN